MLWCCWREAKVAPDLRAPKKVKKEAVRKEKRPVESPGLRTAKEPFQKALASLLPKIHAWKIAFRLERQHFLVGHG